MIFRSTITAFIIFATTWLNAGTPRTVYVKHKAVHAMVGLGILFVCYKADYPQLGLALALAAGLAKDYYDSTHGGKFRVGDVVWTVAPASAVYLALRW